MTATNLITTEDGRVFDRLHFALAITTRQEGDSYTAGAALTFTPFRVLEDGTTETYPECQKSIVSGDTALDMTIDPATAALVSGIASAVAGFAQSKGI